MTDHVSYLASNVKFLIDEHKRTTRQALADALGVSRQAIGHLINGKTKELTPSNLMRAAHHLGFTAEELVTLDFRADPYLAGILSAGGEPDAAIREDNPEYMPARVRRLYQQLNRAAALGKLRPADLDHIERTVELLIRAVENES